MKLFDLLDEVTIDNVSGIGEVPDNRNVDYLGLRVGMKPSVFLSLASKISRQEATSVDYIKQQLDQGQGIASPWLVIDIPVEWDHGSLEKPARVTAHEGRNRMYAVLETEGDVPVETHLFFAGGLRARHIKPEWIEALNTELVPQRQTTATAGPFFSTTTAILERAGAPGTLKAKITRLYGGGVTCAKTQKLKTRSGATTLDKRQANWFQNKHCGGATRVDEVFQSSTPAEWTPRGKDFVTRFEFDNKQIVILVLTNSSYYLDKILQANNLKIQNAESLQGFEIIFYVDGKLNATNLLGTRSVQLFGQVISRLRDFLKNKTWHYVTFYGEAGSRSRLYTRMAHSFAKEVNARVLTHDNMFAVVRNIGEHSLQVYESSPTAAAGELVEVFDSRQQPAKWNQQGTTWFSTQFKFDNHNVGILAIKNDTYTISTVLDMNNIRHDAENWQGYDLSFGVDGKIDVTDLVGVRSVQLFGDVIARLRAFLQDKPWDYITFIGGPGSRNRLYTRLADRLAKETNGIMLRSGNKFAVIKDPKSVGLDEAVQAKTVNWREDRVGSAQRNSTAFEFDDHVVQQNLTQDVGQHDLRDALAASELVPNPQARGYVWLWTVDGEIEQTGTMGSRAISLWNELIGRLMGWLGNHSWDYVTFIGGRGSRNKLYMSLCRLLARAFGARVYFDFDTNDFVVYKPNALQSSQLGETGGVGRIVKGVNTTADVGPMTLKKQAAKFGNRVSRDGVPPVARTNGKI
jgi:hypothetical protein